MMTPARFRTLILAAGVLACTPLAALGQSSQKPFAYHWSVTTDENEIKWRSRVDWAQRVEFDGAPIQKDLYIFYGQFLGKYPRYGLHQLYMQPGGLEEHLHQVRLDVEERLPADFSGYVCIDYENWNLLWDRLVNIPNPGAGPDAADADMKDDWRDYIKSTHPEWSTLSAAQQEALCKATYDASAKEFMTRTLELCNSLRPQARWGLFDAPNSIYGSPENPFGIIGYPADGHGLACQRNDELQWLFDLQGVLFPTIYLQAATVPDSERADFQKGTDTVSTNRQYILSNIKEAMRLAKGKPVIAYMWPRYMRPGLAIDAQFINDLNMRACFEYPITAGADGVAIWESINWAKDYPPFQDLMHDRVNPVLLDIAAAHGLTPPSGGGAGSGGSGSGGGSAGGTQPPPPQVFNGVVSQNAFTPGKPPSPLTSGWVPPKPGSGSNGNNGQSGPAAVSQGQGGTYRVVTGSKPGSAGAAAGGGAGVSTAKGASSSSIILGQGDRRAILQAIRRTQLGLKAAPKPDSVAQVPDDK